VRLGGLLVILTGSLLVAGHGQAAGVVSLIRHALRVLT
jgi:hypothetical protein